MDRAFSALLFGALVVAAPEPASASSGFRCPTSGRIVSRGDSTYEVRNKCREPDHAEQRREYRTVRYKVRRYFGGLWHEVEEEKTVEVVLDDWTYDFGENRFIRLLRFEDGRLVTVHDLNKGYKEPE